MNEPAQRSSTSRHAHYTVLWLALAIIVPVSFWHHQPWGDSALLTLVVVLAVRGIALTRDAGHLERSRIEDPLLGVAGAALALILTRAAGLAPILAATLTGVIGGLCVRWVKGARDYHGAPIYVGAFVGITSRLVFHNFWWVLASGFLAGTLWSLSRDAWVGVGGKMGTMALLSTMGVSLVARALHERGPGAPALEAHGFVILSFTVGLVAAPLTFYLSHLRRWGAVLGSSVPTATVLIIDVLGTSGVARSRRRPFLPLVRIELRGHDDSGTASAPGDHDPPRGTALHLAGPAIRTLLHRNGRYGRRHGTGCSFRSARCTLFCPAPKWISTRFNLNQLSIYERSTWPPSAIPRGTTTRTPAPPRRRRTPFPDPIRLATSCPAPR